jgi:hypothetical protein
MTTALKGRHAVVVARLKNSAENRGSADHTAEMFVTQTSGEHHLIQTAQALSPSICSKIGQQLQEIYDSILCEPLPDQFSELLSGLEYARTKS